MTTQEEKRAIRFQVRQKFRQLSAEERLHRSAAQSSNAPAASWPIIHCQTNPFRCPSCKNMQLSRKYTFLSFKPTTSSSDVTSAKTTSMLGRLASWNPPRSLIPPRSLGGISFRLNSSLFLAWLSRHKEHASGVAKVSTTVFSPSMASCRPTNRAFASPFRYSATSRPSHTTFSWIAWSINSPFPHHVRMLRCFLFGLKPRRDFSGFLTPT